jgi:hypothetical protein
VTVRRFANSLTRDIADFDRYSEWIFQHTLEPADEMDWLKRQGPWSPGLIDYLGTITVSMKRSFSSPTATPRP